MSLPVPDAPDNSAIEFARNIILRVNQATENVGREYIASYQTTWGVTEPGSGSRFTQQFMQSIVDSMPQNTALLLLQMGARFVTTYGNGIPEYFRSPAWKYSIVGGNIVIGELLPIWRIAPPPPPEEVTPALPVNHPAQTTIE